MECQFFEGKNEARLFRAAATAGSDCWPVGYFLDIFRFVVCTAWCDTLTYDPPQNLAFSTPTISQHHQAVYTSFCYCVWLWSFERVSFVVDSNETRPSYTSVSLTHTYQLETRWATVKTFIISQTFIGTALQCPNSEVSTCLFVANLRPGDASPSFWKILKCMDSMRNFQFFFPDFSPGCFFRQGSVGVKKAGGHVVQCWHCKLQNICMQILYSLKLIAKGTWTLMAFGDYSMYFFFQGNMLNFCGF